VVIVVPSIVKGDCHIYENDNDIMRNESTYCCLCVRNNARATYEISFQYRG
jgi:hypothetical protein